jgi:hypothetical protein
VFGLSGHDDSGQIFVPDFDAHRNAIGASLKHTIKHARIGWRRGINQNLPWNIAPADSLVDRLQKLHDRLAFGFGLKCGSTRELIAPCALLADDGVLRDLGGIERSRKARKRLPSSRKRLEDPARVTILAGFARTRVVTGPQALPRKGNPLDVCRL